MNYSIGYYDGACMVYFKNGDVAYTLTPICLGPPNKDAALCTGCGREIPVARLEALPDTDTCVKCSEVQKYVGDSRYGETAIARTTEETRRLRLHYE